MGAPRLGGITSTQRHQDSTIVHLHSLTCKMVEPRGVVLPAEIARFSSLHIRFQPYA
jgi:hypothetical protein